MPIGRGFIMSLAVRCGDYEDPNAPVEDALRGSRHDSRMVEPVSGEPAAFNDRRKGRSNLRGRRTMVKDSTHAG